MASGRAQALHSLRLACWANGITPKWESHPHSPIWTIWNIHYKPLADPWETRALHHPLVTLTRPTLFGFSTPSGL